MNVQVEKAKTTKPILEKIIEIDKTFYTNFDYTDVSWYFRRYTDENEVYLLKVDDEIVGYFLFCNISEKLYQYIRSLKYEEDYSFPLSEVNVKSKYEYMPSILVKREYRQHSLTLIRELKKQMDLRDNVAIIAVSKIGNLMAKRVAKFVGWANQDKGIGVYIKEKK